MNNLNQPYQFCCGLELKNRMILAPMTTGSGTADGGLSLEDTNFLMRRSEGYGAVIIGSHSISPGGGAFSCGWNIYQPQNHAALKRLAEMLHEKDTKAILQIYHAGRMAQPFFNGGRQPLAPSRVPAKRDFASYPREMTSPEIKRMIQAFESATKTAIQLGMDGVELHGANTYLLQQFFSPESNRRHDEWGGSPEKRVKFAKEVIKACSKVIQAETKSPFVLGYRFSPEEYESLGIRLKDTKWFLKEISNLPLDYVHISSNDYRKNSLDGKKIIPEIKEALSDSIPLIGCGNIRNQKDVKNILEEVPLFSVGKAAIIDPDWSLKIQKGQEHIIKKKLEVSDQGRAAIPNSLWHMILSSPNQYLTSAERERGER